MTFDELRKQYPNLSDDAIADLAAVSLNLAGSPKTRRGLQGLIKEVFPNTSIPEIDTERNVEERFAKETKARQEFEAKQEARWAQEDASRTKSGVRSRFGLSEEEMTNMEKMMTEGKLPAQYEWAAPIFKQQTQVAEPTNYGVSGYGPLNIEQNAKGLGDLMGDPDNWSRSTAHQMIDEMQKNGKKQAF